MSSLAQFVTLATALALLPACASHRSSPLASPASEWINLAHLQPAPRIDLRYATTNNFLGRPLYPADSARAYLRAPAAQAIARVQSLLHQQGLTLVILDAYRPLSITRSLWLAASPAERAAGYVANPEKGSIHNRGFAVDVTLADLHTGLELPMPSAFDDFSERAWPEYLGGNPEALRNRNLLRNAMESAGFTVNSKEWWHFDFKNWQSHPVEDLSFKDLQKN